MDIRPVTLEGRHVRLEPLAESHADALFPEADEPDIWQYMPYGEVNSADKLHAVIVDLPESASGLADALRDLLDGQA